MWEALGNPPIRPGQSIKHRTQLIVSDDTAVVENDFDLVVFDSDVYIQSYRSIYEVLSNLNILQTVIESKYLTVNVIIKLDRAEFDPETGLAIFK